MEAIGFSGQIEFDGQYVTITRKGFVARSMAGKGEKRLHISQIAAVQWKPAGAVIDGFIQFTVPGGIERRFTIGSQTGQAAQDENSVVFSKKQQPAFEALRTALDAAIAAQHAPGAVVSVADEIAKLGALLTDGLLSQAEFEQQKARLLGG